MLFNTSGQCFENFDLKHHLVDLTSGTFTLALTVLGWTGSFSTTSTALFFKIFSVSTTSTMTFTLWVKRKEDDDLTALASFAPLSPQFKSAMLATTPIPSANETHNTCPTQCYEGLCCIWENKCGLCTSTKVNGPNGTIYPDLSTFFGTSTATTTTSAAGITTTTTSTLTITMKHWDGSASAATTTDSGGVVTSSTSTSTFYLTNWTQGNVETTTSTDSGGVATSTTTTMAYNIGRITPLSTMWSGR